MPRREFVDDHEVAERLDVLGNGRRVKAGVGGNGCGVGFAGRPSNHQVEDSTELGKFADFADIVDDVFRGNRSEIGPEPVGTGTGRHRARFRKSSGHDEFGDVGPRDLGQLPAVKRLRRREHPIHELVADVNLCCFTDGKGPQLDDTDPTSERIRHLLRREEAGRTGENKLSSRSVSIKTHLCRQQESITIALELVDRARRG